MGSGRSYLAAFARLPTIVDPEERRRIARQGLAMLAQIAEREPAPLEGIPSDQLLEAVRTALSDGILIDLDWLSAAAGAVALFELAQALPPSAERRELGRRVLTRLRDADRATFVRLLIALARSSPKLLIQDGLRARTEIVLCAPLTAPAAIGELALGLLAQPSLAERWVTTPASGSLPGRRLAARILAHGAREAVRRHDAGDRGGGAILGRARGTLDRLVGDRESLVWSVASIARGLLAHVDSDLAAQIDRDLRPNASPTELRRGSASAASALERGGAAARWRDVIVARAARDSGVARGAILGLAGYAVRAPDQADALATLLVERAPLDGTEALAELRREERMGLLPRSTAVAIQWLRTQMTATDAVDDGRWALLHALEAELTHGPRPEGLGVPLDAAREALDEGDVPVALSDARAAVDEVVAAAEWFERATDEDPIERRHSMHLLRELDRELLADNVLTAVLALAPESDRTRHRFSRALASIEASLLARESRPEYGAVAHGGLRIARLRALVRLLDGVRRDDGEEDVATRLAAVRLLMARAAEDQSPLRRAVWAALTRAGDALLRDDHAEVTDLLLVWTLTFPDDDFAIVREASMLPEVVSAFEAYGRLQQAAWSAADPSDHEALSDVVERVGELADALPPERSPRVESVRLAIARFGNQLARITAAASHSAVPAGAIDAIAGELAALARRVYGAHQRLGIPGDDCSSELETAVRGIATAISRDVRTLEEAIAIAIEAARGALPPALASALERALLSLAHRPQVVRDPATSGANEAYLPGWVPLSRLVGAFHVLRTIGHGAGGSVLLAVRAEQRHHADRELLALKVPDYSGAAARNLSEQEFEALFRDEAGALLALPQQRNLARFVTFDASAQPKPILVMEFVRGPTLERVLEGALTTARAFSIIDDLLAGLEAMHTVGVAHLDVKPANVILREGAGEAVLVDFGLAGRRLRTGCGSPHYAACEVWAEDSPEPPFAADTYAAACVAFEILTNRVLMDGDTLNELLAQHHAKQPGAARLEQLGRDRRLDALVELLRAAVAKSPRTRPTVAGLRAGFHRLAPELRSLPWPLGQG